MEYRRRRRTRFWAPLFQFLFIWFAGAATAMALGYYCIPSIYIQPGEDGEIESVQVDWENTVGKRIVEVIDQ